MAKLFAGDLAQQVAYDCMQLHGGLGYVLETDIARAWRDVRVITIAGGTSEIMKEIIRGRPAWTGGCLTATDALVVLVTAPGAGRGGTDRARRSSRSGSRRAGTSSRACARSTW